jgi:hypothetical protein
LDSKSRLISFPSKTLRKKVPVGGTMHDTQIEVVKQYQCRHIFIDGRRCGSPCLRQEEFCYYHHTSRKPLTDPRRRRSRRSTFQLPLPEDRSAIQSSIGEVLQRIASNDMDPRRAGLLLYGLQIASLNLAQSRTATKTSAEHETVEEISIDPTLGILAPRAELSKSTTRKSPVLRLIEEIIQSEQKEAAAARSTVLPTLQAAEGTIPWDQIPIRSRTFLNRCNTNPSGALHSYRSLSRVTVTVLHSDCDQPEAATTRSYAEQIAGETGTHAQQNQVNQIEFESLEQH